MLAAEDVETQMRWEEVIREQIWNASTNPNVRPGSPPAPPFPPSPRMNPTRPGSGLVGASGLLGSSECKYTLIKAIDSFVPPDAEDAIA